MRMDEAIPALEGLDGQAALVRAGGDRSLYLRLLRQFLRQEGAAVQITQGLARGEWSAAERQAHSVKGLAANLGAGGVQQAAARLERALRERSNPEGPLADFQATLSDFIERLRLALPPERPASSEPVAVRNFGAVAVQMDGLLGCFDAAAAELFEAHQELFRAMLSAAEFADFKELLENYALDEARLALRRSAAGRAVL